MKRKLTMFLALFLISIGIVTAQIQVRGTVVDEQGEPLIGATVQIKGTAQGTVTDANGNFTLSAPATGTLVVSYVGYQTQEVGVRANVRVQLQSESELLEDVIIVAYGTVTREAKTGAVATVSTDAISSAPVASVDRALGGKLAG
ncbi:MAG: carboxypeptidase-like regulatory domain-containing protein, partial [Petrimonas sp.]